MSGGWGDRFDPPCKKTTPHPRHTWGTGTCPGITDPDALTSQQPATTAGHGGSMRPMRDPGKRPVDMVRLRYKGVVLGDVVLIYLIDGTVEAHLSRDAVRRAAREEVSSA